MATPTPKSERAARECWDAFVAHGLSYAEAVGTLVLLFKELADKSGENCETLRSCWQFHAYMLTPPSGLLSASVEP